MFIYNDGNLSAKKVPIDIDITVNDFVIHNGCVYFCGERGGQGIFGYFDVSDFFNINQTYFVTDLPMNTTTSTVSTLNKMVLYTSNGDLELVAVGKTAATLECVAELRQHGTIWSYRVGELPTGVFPYTEEILSITQTDDYVVTGGFFHYATNFPTFRVFDKADLFAASGLQNTAINSISGGQQSCDFDDSQMLMGPVQGNWFLLATYWKECYNAFYNPTPSPEFKGINIGLYEINPSMLPLGTAVTWQTGYRIEQDNVNYGWKLRGMTQLNHSNMFYLLQEAEISGIPQMVSMVCELPLSSPPALVSAYYGLESQFLSIDGYNNNQEYVMNGKHYIENANLIFCETFTSQYNNCLMYHSLNTTDMFMSEKDRSYAFSVTSYAPITMYHESVGTVQNISTNIDCQ